MANILIIYGQVIFLYMVLIAFIEFFIVILYCCSSIWYPCVSPEPRHTNRVPAHDLPYYLWHSPLPLTIDSLFYTPPHDSGGVLWFRVGRPCVRPPVSQSYVRPSVFRFRMITWVNINGFLPNLVCALILWRSGLELGKFRQIWTEVFARDMPIFSFPEDKEYRLIKCQGILTKLGTCIDMEEIWFGIADGQISSMFDRVICPRHDNGGVLNVFIFTV